jgi:hypothetical protein
MKNKLLIMVMGMIILLAIIPQFANAEIYLWNNVIVDNATSVVKYHAYYWFDDTSARGIGKQKDVPIDLIYDVQALPYDLTIGGYYGSVDWCNFTTRHYHNIYGTTFTAWQGFSGGELLNTTTEIQSVYFSGGGFTTDKITINMRDKDSLTADMTCHYTDSRSLYVENVLIGRYTTYMPSFECEGCTQYTLEELSYQTEKSDEITANEVAMYDKIQIAVDWNFQIWLILSWIIKIAMVLVAVGLIFASVYYFYVFLRDIEKEI